MIDGYKSYKGGMGIDGSIDPDSNKWISEIVKFRNIKYSEDMKKYGPEFVDEMYEKLDESLNEMMVFARKK